MSIKIKTGIVTVGTAGTDFDGQTEITFFQISTSGLTSTTIIREDSEGTEIGRYPISAVAEAKEVTLRKDPTDLFKTASGTIDAVGIAII
jgi:hypothetical protein